MIFRKIRQQRLWRKECKELQNRIIRMFDSYEFWDAVKQTHLAHLKFNRRRTIPDRTTSVYVHPGLKYWEVIPERKRGKK